MPAPIISQNKFKEQVENNIYLREKMRDAFIQAFYSLYNSPLGPLDTFEADIDGVKIRYTVGDQIYINDTTYNDCSPTLKKQAYDRLEKFMKLAIESYNNQFNL